MSHCEDWNDLVGRQVQIQQHGQTIRTGRVEATTAAADALWLAAHGVEPRALYEKAQGYTALLSFEPERTEAMNTGPDRITDIKVLD